LHPPDANKDKSGSRISEQAGGGVVAARGQPGPNDTLRACRIDRGWSQDRLAHELLRAATAAGLTLPDPTTLVPQISRWENGRKEPSEFYRRLLRNVYRASDRDLGLDPTASERADRGELPGARLGYALSRGARVDLTVVEDVKLIADGLRRLDRRFGAATVTAELEALLAGVCDLQQHSMTPEPRRQLAQVVADVATLRGWLSLDAGRPERAWKHFQTGTRAAVEAGDPLLEAFATAESSYVLLAANRPAEALVRIEAGEAALGRVEHGRIRAWLAAARAEILAVSGQLDPCRAALDLAHAHLLSHQDGQPAAPYVDYLNPWHLHRWMGNCLATLRHADAAPLIEQALAQVDPSFVRAQAGLVIDLATAHAAVGDLEQACIAASEGVRLAAETRSARQLRRVLDLRDSLRPAAGSAVYAELLDQLGEATAPDRT
jgi:transcriptional regulator with XRE-family HTH domain